MYLIGMLVHFAAENIVSDESIATLVDRFYGRVRQDMRFWAPSLRRRSATNGSRSS